MPRTARVVFPGYPHHIVQRGVRSMDIFRSDEDRVLYLRLLAAEAKRHGLLFWAWALMTNHVHLVAVPPDSKSLTRAIGEAHRRYTWLINRRDGVRGHLFQERFYSYPIQQDGHLLAVLRYIELNPVNAGLAASPGDYRWSSAAYHLKGRRDILVQPSPVREMVPSWRAFLQDGADEARQRDVIERHMRSGLPLGEPAWIRQMESREGRSLTPAMRGRPPLGKPKRNK